MAKKSTTKKTAPKATKAKSGAKKAAAKKPAPAKRSEAAEKKKPTQTDPEIEASLKEKAKKQPQPDHKKTKSPAQISAEKKADAAKAKADALKKGSDARESASTKREEVATRAQAKKEEATTDAAADLSEKFPEQPDYAEPTTELDKSLARIGKSIVDSISRVARRTTVKDFVEFLQKSPQYGRMTVLQQDPEEGSGKLVRAVIKGEATSIPVPAVDKDGFVTYLRIAG